MIKFHKIYLATAVMSFLFCLGCMADEANASNSSDKQNMENNPPTTEYDKLRNSPEIITFRESLKGNTKIPIYQNDSATDLPAFAYNDPNDPDTSLSFRSDPYMYHFKEILIEPKTPPPLEQDKKIIVESPPKKPDIRPPTVDITPSYRDKINDKFESIRGVYKQSVILLSDANSNHTEACNLLVQVKNKCDEITKEIASKPETLQPFESYNDKDADILEIKASLHRLGETASRIESILRAVDEFHNANIEVKGVVVRNRGSSCLIRNPDSKTDEILLLRTGASVPNSRGLSIVISEIHDDFVIFDFQNIVKIRADVKAHKG
jgi:hypothetical protein